MSLNDQIEARRTHAPIRADLVLAACEKALLEYIQARDLTRDALLKKVFPLTWRVRKIEELPQEYLAIAEGYREYEISEIQKLTEVAELCHLGINSPDVILDRQDFNLLEQFLKRKER